MNRIINEKIRSDFIDYITGEIANQAEGFITTSENRILTRIDYVFIEDHYPIFMELLIGSTTFKVTLDTRINAIAYASAAKLLAEMWGFEKEFRNDEGTVTFCIQQAISDYGKNITTMTNLCEKLKFCFTQTVEDYKDLILYDSHNFLDRLWVLKSKSPTAFANLLMAEKTKGLVEYQRNKGE